MKNFVYAIVLALCITACSAQEKNKADNQSNPDQSLLNQPKASWKVNKEVDEDGNIIRYDSTYTWSYTNFDGDSMSVDVDSVMRSFDEYFNTKFPSYWNDGFMTPIRPPMMYDSTFYRGFWRDDYFHDRWKNNIYDMEKMFMQMDSIRMKFFDDTYPGLIKPEEDSSSDN